MKKMGTVNLYGQKWKVYEVDNMDPNFLGLCYWEENKIEIKAGLTKDQFRKVFLHELLHAIFCRAGFYVTGMPTELEEVMVDQIATIMTENFSFILKTLK